MMQLKSAYTVNCTGSLRACKGFRLLRPFTYVYFTAEARVSDSYGRQVRVGSVCQRAARHTYACLHLSATAFGTAQMAASAAVVCCRLICDHSVALEKKSMQHWSEQPEVIEIQGRFAVGFQDEAHFARRCLDVKRDDMCIIPAEQMFIIVALLCEPTWGCHSAAVYTMWWQWSSDWMWTCWKEGSS